MSFADKFHNKAQELRGRAKLKTGQATGDERLQREGRTDQVKATSSRQAKRSRTPCVDGGPPASHVVDQA